MADRVNPIVITHKETGDKYTLEFSRETVKFAESRGFAVNEVGDYPMTKLPELFYYSFRMHHKNMARSQTDAIMFDDLKGLYPEFIERLVQLYAAPMQALVKDEEDSGKNSKMTVEM